MATLNGKQINNTYSGLLKTNDETALGATEKTIQDGDGNDSTLSMGTASASFTGTLDLSGATVTGLPADVNTTYDLASAQNGANVEVTLTGSDASVDTVTLVAGTNVTLADDGSNNITVTTADTNYTYTYTLSQNGANVDLELAGGNGGSNSEVQVQPGTNITLTQNGPTSFVIDATDTDTTYDLGGTTNVAGTFDFTLTGSDASSDSVRIIAGTNVTLNNSGVNELTIDAAAGLVNGTGSDSLKQNDALTGTAADASGSRAIALGNGAEATGLNSVALGRSASSTAFANGLALGAFASATADGSVALGQGVTAATADTVSVKALEVQTNSTPTSGGIIISDAAGTDRRLNIDSSGNLQIDASPVGGAGGLESGSGTDSMQSAASLTSQAADASGTRAIALGNDADGLAEDSIAIGNTAYASGITNIAIGNDARAEGDTFFARRNIAIGHESLAQQENALAVGVGTLASAATSTAVGFNAQATGLRGLALGLASSATAFSSMAAGNYTQATAEGTVALGGFNTTATQTNAIAIGKETNATASGAIALGAGVTGNIANTLSTKALELQTDSTPTAGGIIMSDAGGTDRRINIASDGTLQIDSNAVGVIPVFRTSRVSETQATSSCDTIRASVLIPANTFGAGDILDVSAVQSLSGSNGTTYAELWISTTGTVGSAPSGENVAQIHTSSDGTGKFNKTLYVNAASGTGGTEFIENGINNEAGLPATAMQGASVVTAGTIDWTVDQYLAVKVCIDNTGATWTNYGAVIRKIN
jgi:hypothetical protein